MKKLTVSQNLEFRNIEMERSKIISHEIGHGIIGVIFNDEYWHFEGIKLNPQHKFNENDLAYNITKPVNDLKEKVDMDNHLAASIDGLLLLAGIAGMSVFENHNSIKWKSNATIDDLRSFYDFEGSSGDFEIINARGRPYGWYLFTCSQVTSQQADIRHVRLLNLLKDVFRENKFESISNNLKQKLDEKEELSIEDFKEMMDDDFILETRTKIETHIKNGIGKPILIE